MQNTTAPAIPPTPPLAQHGPCIRCGYDLRGLAADAACPECGTPISETTHAPAFHELHHRWLARFEIGIWTLLAAMILNLSVGLLGVLFNFLPYTFSFYSQFVFELTAYADVLEFAALWLLTSPEPGPARFDAPRISAGWSRWLRVAAYVTLAARRCLPPSTILTNPGVLESALVPLTQLATAASIICLLIMLRQYAIRIHDARTAKTLQWTTVLGVVAALAILLQDVLVTAAPPRFLELTMYPMILLMLVYGCSLLWALSRFALSLRRAVRRRSLPVKRIPAAISILAAMLLGAVAGYLIGEGLSSRAGHGQNPDLSMIVTRMTWIWWQAGAILGFIFLPNRLALAYRRFARYR